MCDEPVSVGSGLCRRDEITPRTGARQQRPGGPAQRLAGRPRQHANLPSSGDATETNSRRFVGL
eukprot:4086744-Pleurochrysis_carterae.AAC.5